MSRFLHNLVRRSAGDPSTGSVQPRIGCWPPMSTIKKASTEILPEERGRMPSSQDDGPSSASETMTETQSTLPSPTPLTAAPGKAVPPRGNGIEKRQALVPRGKRQIRSAMKNPVSGEPSRQPEPSQAVSRPGSPRIEAASRPLGDSELTVSRPKISEERMPPTLTMPAAVEAATPPESSIQPAIAAPPPAHLTPPRIPGEQAESVETADLHPAPVYPRAPTPPAAAATAEPAHRVVQVHIGKIEVRAKPASPAPPSSQPSPSRTASLGFEEYLALRTYRAWRDR